MEQFDDSISMQKIAALYVEKNGTYSEIEGIEIYDEARDAMTYCGPYAVIAHPPCNLWCKMAPVNQARYGGTHNLIGNDGGKFAHALACVRNFGGILEHPADSIAWKCFGLTAPQKGKWSRCNTHDNAWVCEVSQSAYGHKARKRTWLYCVLPLQPRDLNWDSPDGEMICGHIARYKKKSLSKKQASATPRAFAKALIDIVQAH